MSEILPYRIGLMLYDGCMPSGLFSFADLLAAANRRAGKQVFETSFVAIHADPVVCAHGHRLSPECTLRGTPLNAVLVPSFWMESVHEVPARLHANQSLVVALSQLGKDVLLLGYCSGVALMAAAGRLNGQDATVSWWLADMLRKEFPKTSWTVEHSVVMARHAGTGAGTIGGQLLGKELIDCHIGPETYNNMARLMVKPKDNRTHPVFQYMDLVHQGDEFTRELYLLAQALPAAEVNIGRLATHLGTTERTLARKVSATTGVPISTYLRRIKLNQVSERLILTSAPASAICEALGFNCESSMRRMFKDVTGMTPTQYRKTYQWRPQEA